MGRASGGGGRGGGGRSGGGGGVQLPAGFSWGATLKAERGSFRADDVVKIPSDSRSSGVTGRVVKVNRKNLVMDAPSWNGSVRLTIPIDRAAGGMIARGNTVFKVGAP